MLKELHINNFLPFTHPLDINKLALVNLIIGNHSIGKTRLLDYINNKLALEIDIAMMPGVIPFYDLRERYIMGNAYESYSQEHKDIVLELLQKLFPKLISFEIHNYQQNSRFEFKWCTEKPLYNPICGNATLQHLAAVILMLPFYKNKVLLLDNFAHGVDEYLISKVWPKMISLIEDLNIQSFIVTQSHPVQVIVSNKDNYKDKSHLKIIELFEDELDNDKIIAKQLLNLSNRYS
jgi:predicted ATPase